MQLWNEYLPARAKTGLSWGCESEMTAATENCPVRQRVVVGEVHDLNAAAMGGISTHAGLFGTADDACRAALWPIANLYGSSGDLRSDTIKAFWKTDIPGRHCLGWDTPSPKGSSASSYWPVSGRGHLGFTGCSIWLAPSHRIAVTFCSNRIHPIVEGGAKPSTIKHPRLLAFKAFRPKLHHLVLKSLNRIGYQFNV